eukprot:tig00020909_g15331.t1
MERLLGLLLSAVLVLSASANAETAYPGHEAFGQAANYDPLTSHITHVPRPITALPGYTRSVVRRDYALVTPESRVGAPLPGWTKTSAVVYISPAMGAQFLMYVATLEDGGYTNWMPAGAERFVYVLSGSLALSFSSGGSLFKAGTQNQTRLEGPGAFCYLPPDSNFNLAAEGVASVLVYERTHAPLPGGNPRVIVGHERDFEGKVVPGEYFILRKLLPVEPAYDFNVHVMDFNPGEYLAIKEVHYHEHGLLLLEGEGIYRLGDDWYPVTAGDVIWMGPYVPQWYAALGKSRSRYIIYKDVHRAPLSR